MIEIRFTNLNLVKKLLRVSRSSLMVKYILMQKNVTILFVMFLGLLALLSYALTKQKQAAPLSLKSTYYWNMESIDTVKFSRDLARQYESDTGFDTTIDLQVKAIADAGANYIAIGTPYDKEFIPFLGRWVKTARKYGLSVWFRGNFSGWEGWFDYKAITRDQHKAMLKQFILDNGNLFEDGDIFSACTECENGGPGDPRQNGDAVGHRQFLVDEYQITRDAFRKVGKNVASNYFPMNLDVAKLVMDKATTGALGGMVVIDHYVASPQDVDNGVTEIANLSGGKVVLGEFGAPIPDLHGNMTQEEQASWIRNSLDLLSHNPFLVGVNYWTSFGGSTKLWEDDGTARLGVNEILAYYRPRSLSGFVKNEAGQPVTGATLSNKEQTVQTDNQGRFIMRYLTNDTKINVTAKGYKPVLFGFTSDEKPIRIDLKKINEGPLFKLQKFLFQKLSI